MVQVAGVDIDRILIFLLIASVTVLTGLLARELIQRLFSRRLENIRSTRLIARFVEYAVFAVGFYLALNYLMGFNLVAFAASLGIISIAVAFSSQQVIQNLIAGVLIVLIRPIRLEDWVEIGNSGLCNVRDVTLSYTVLRNVDGRIIMMPNSSALSSSVTNYTKSGHVQIPLRIDIPASSDMEKVKNIIHDVLDSLEELHHTTLESETQHLTQLFGRFQRSTRKNQRTPLDPRLLIVNVTPTIITLEIRVWIDDFRRRDLIKADVMDALTRNLAELEHPAKDDEMKLKVLREMLDEMKERQNHLEDLISHREKEDSLEAR